MPLEGTARSSKREQGEHRNAYGMFNLNCGAVGGHNSGLAANGCVRPVWDAQYAMKISAGAD